MSVRLSTQIPPEYTWYMSSDERSRDGPDPLNPTNNITVPLKMPRARLPVVQINLGSVELPITQYTIESLWNKLYFSEGLALIANMQSENSVRQFTVKVNGVTYTAELPLFLNPVVAVDDTDPAAPIFTTQFNHALDMRRFWTWDPIQLISTPLTQASDPDLVNLTGDNPNLTVLDQTRFQLNNVPGGTVWTNPSGVFGYVYAPAIPSPVQLASVVTEALNLVLPGAFRVSYSTETGLFTFESLRTLSSCDGSPPLNTADVIYILISTRNSLAALMGFGLGDVPVPPRGIPSADGSVSNQAFFGSVSQSMPSNCDPKTVCTTVSLTGGYGYQCRSSVCIPEGNYNGDSFRQALYLEFNRFYFEPGEAADPLLRAVFAFSDAAGTFLSFPIEYGAYTASQFAQVLETGMNAADTQGNTYTVEYDATTHQFCFSSDNATPFGLEFGTGTDTVHPRIGFQSVCYRGQTDYCSVTPVVVPTVQCCGTDLDEKYPSNVVVPTLNTVTSKYCLSASKPPCQSVIINDAGGGLLQITTNAPAPVVAALGFQLEDVIDLTITALADTFQVRVVQILDAFTVRVDAGSIPTAGLGADEPGSVCLNGLVSMNLYFDSSLQNAFPARYLGFPQVDQLWPSSLCAPFCYNLSSPSYVLLCLTRPNGATHNNHAYKNSNIPNVFAKVILYPQFRLERPLSYTMYLSEMVEITEVGFLFLNPDHTPYQLHGKDWSSSLVFTVAENTSAQLTGF